MSRVIDFTTRRAINCNCAAMGEQECPEHGSHHVGGVVTALADTTVPVIVPDTVSPLTKQELYKKLYEKSATDIGGLISFYKATGKWNAAAERLMGRVVEDIKVICASIVG